jgi:hypothetical protein
LLIVATEVGEELQVTSVVRFWVVLSENVPVALNCSVAPRETTGSAGVIAMDFIVSEVTVKVVEPEMFPDVAVIVVVPWATAVARPAALIVATPVLEDFHVTVAFRFWVLPSEYVPVAVNCWVVAGAMEGPAGVTAMEESVLAGGRMNPPPPPPPQPAMRNMISRKKKVLFDFIGAHTGWDQCRVISPPLKVPHVPPFLDNNPNPLDLQGPATWLARGLPQSLLVFVGI